MSIKQISCTFGRTVPNPYVPFANAKPEITVTAEILPNENPDEVRKWLQGYVEICIAQACDQLEIKMKEEAQAKKMSQGGAYPMPTPAPARAPTPDYSRLPMAPSAPSPSYYPGAMAGPSLRPAEQLVPPVPAQPSSPVVAAQSPYADTQVPQPEDGDPGPNYDDLLPPPSSLGDDVLIP